MGRHSVDYHPEHDSAVEPGHQPEHRAGNAPDASIAPPGGPIDPGVPGAPDIPGAPAGPDYPGSPEPAPGAPSEPPPVAPDDPGDGSVPVASSSHVAGETVL